MEVRKTESSHFETQKRGRQHNLHGQRHLEDLSTSTQYTLFKEVTPLVTAKTSKYWKISTHHMSLWATFSFKHYILFQFFESESCLLPYHILQ